MAKQLHSRQLAFGPFVVDVTEKMLLRDEMPVALTPKAFQLLLILVENPGHLLEKNELMKRLWPDTFVEEANLSNNISLLRKALGDTPYIETVPRLGYRFLENVTELKREAPADGVHIPQSELVGAGDFSIRRHKLSPYFVWLALAVVAAVAGRLLIHRSETPKADSPFLTPRITRLTMTGRTNNTAISPDGKYVAFTLGETVENEDQSSLWVRQVATTTDIQIAPSTAAVVYEGLTFSKDGNLIYYVRRNIHNFTDLALYQAPTLGGVSRKVLERVHTAVTFSPDGKQFAFVRRSPGWKETSLIIANADGSSERVLATRKMPNGFTSIFSGPAWSPDGKVIAVGVGTGDAPLVRSTVAALHVGNGGEEQITPAHWSRVGRLGWMVDGRGLLITAAEQLDIYQLWYITYPTGETRRITNNESIDYRSLSLTADSQTAVTIQNDTTSRIWIASGNDLARPRGPITPGKYDGRHGLRWTPDGRIVYHSLAGGSEDLWIMAADGTSQKQITLDAAATGEPDVSPDGRFIVFSSQRGGPFDLWRTETTGDNTKQLTKGMNARVPQITPDGKWVIFAGRKALWKVSMDGGEATRLNNNDVNWPALSPNGKLIACYYQDQLNQPMKLALIPADGGDPIRVFDVNGPTEGGIKLRWMPDGRNITFRDSSGQLWNQPLNGGKPVKLTDFKGRIRQFDWSRDGNLVFSVVQNDSDVVLVRNSR